MWPAIGVTAVLLAGDRVLKALSRKGKLRSGEGQPPPGMPAVGAAGGLDRGGAPAAASSGAASASGASGYPAGAGRRTEQPV